MSLRQRILHWLLSPITLVLVSFALILGLEEWRSEQQRAAYEREQAERRAQAPAPARKPLAPLFKAIREKSADAVRAAIAQGADPNAPDDKGTKPLNFAFLKDGGWPGRKDVIEALLAGGADVNARFRGDYSALHLAVTRSEKNVVELLIDRGADMNAKAKDGKTPLMNAHSLEIVEVLIARGAKWGSGETGIDPTGSRIREAARKGDIKLIEMLLSKGSDPNRASKGGGTAIVSAVGAGHAEAVRTLLAAGAKVDGKLYDGSSVLHIAAEENHVEIARLLIAAGADVNATRPSGWTPLHVASSRCHEELAELLVAKGANRNALDKHGKAPLPCYAFARKPARSAAMQIASCR